MNHSTSRRKAKAAPQMEATVLIEGTITKIIPCTAKSDFQVGNSQVKAGEKFYLVRSERRKNRYYVVHYNSTRNAYQCSCGANMSHHDHLSTVRQYVMDHVVVPAAVAKAESSEQVEVPAMTVPVTVAEIKEAKILKEAREIIAQHDGTRAWTPEEYKIIQKADRLRQEELGLAVPRASGSPSRMS